MLRIMLCGASDTERVWNEFRRAVTDLGGEPWHYPAGDIVHTNSATSAFDENSRATVQSANLCVFVIVEKYGALTWLTEMATALSAGKPFLVFCLDSTYHEYLVLRGIADHSAIDPAKRQMVALLRELESDRQLTVVPFGYGTFGDRLRVRLAALFEQCLGQLEERNRRGAVAQILTGNARLTTSDLTTAVAIALDEIEDKTVRKRALLALKGRNVTDEETVRALLGSPEQGIQRLTALLLGELYTDRPVDPEFFEHCVQIANQSDDVGLARRLIPVLLDMDLSAALKAFGELAFHDVGSRRRVAEALEQFEAEIVSNGLTGEAAALLIRCLGELGEVEWKVRCRRLQQRLSAADQLPPERE